MRNLRWGIVVVIIAVAALGTGIAFEYAGLGGAANLATIVALLSQLAAVVGWAKARDERRRPSEVLTEALRALGEFLRRCVADGPGGIDNPQLISRWSAGQIAVYTSGKAFPPEDFVADCLEVSAAEHRWPGETSRLEARQLCEAAVTAYQKKERSDRVRRRRYTTFAGITAVVITVASVILTGSGAPAPANWTQRIGGPVVADVAVANGMVYAASGDQSLFALDASTGMVRWHRYVGARSDSSPAVADGIVYIGSWFGHTVYAFDAASGKPLWTYLTGGSIDSSPTVVDGTVYIGSNDGRVYALNARTGHRNWYRYLVRQPPIAS
jgi:PQQ-like domain